MPIGCLGFRFCFCICPYFTRFSDIFGSQSADFYIKKRHLFDCARINAAKTFFHQSPSGTVEPEKPPEPFKISVIGGSMLGLYGLVSLPSHHGSAINTFPCRNRCFTLRMYFRLSFYMAQLRELNLILHRAAFDAHLPPCAISETIWRYLSLFPDMLMCCCRRRLGC